MNSVEGLIFHIIHGSFVDGYGIRTTVFLKGCPLRCLWCCNPEGQRVHKELKYSSKLCNGCENCLPVCPESAITLDPESGNEKIRIDRTLCTNCGKCIDVCYTDSLDYFGKCYTVDELFDIVKKDEQFYREQGGGVTIGGGEPTMQPRFTHDFISRCKENYIHTAVDTCGYTTSSEGFKILEEADLVLFDLKGMNYSEHLKYTQVSNEVILNNLKLLDAAGKHIIIRVPIIPGHTDSDENIETTAKFLSGLKSVERVDLMAYHEYGIVKYDELGMVYTLRTQPLSQDRLDQIKQHFEHNVLNVQLGG
ncbi:glycyl-radical enzyme activating protein [Thermodesulfobacteriota bacterium]